MKVSHFILIFCLNICGNQGRNFLSDQLNHTSSHSLLSKATFKLIESFYQHQGDNFHLISAVGESSFTMFKDIANEILRDIDQIDLTAEVEDYKDLRKLTNRKRYSNVIFIDSAKTFRKLFVQMTPMQFKLRRFFSFVAIKELKISEIEDIFELVWKIFIKHVHLIMRTGNDTVDLFTFMPFNEQRCGDTRPMIINSFDRNLMAWKTDIFHPSNKSNNLHGCPLLIGAAVGAGKFFLINLKLFLKFFSFPRRTICNA